MKTIVLNGSRMPDRDRAHDYLARMLQLPAYYGRNLDALYDCLGELGPCTLVLVNAGALRRAGGFGEKLLRTLEDAAQAVPDLRLVLDETGGGI